MYPLNVQLPAGAGFAVANDADEHQTLTDAGYLPAIEVSPLLAQAEVSPLLAQAEALGIKVDKRWSDKRLADEIAKAV
jgi:hypothetical protein